jgi:hypothetical protein
VLDHLITGYDKALIPGDVLASGRALIADAVPLLNGYMKYLKRADKTVPPKKQHPTSE